MPTISLTDNFGLIIDAKPLDSSAFAKYLRDPGAIVAALKNPAAIRDIAIGQVPVDTLSFGFSITQPVSLGASGVTLNIIPSLEGSIEIAKGGTLFGDESDSFADPVNIPDQQAFVSLVIDAGLEVDAAAQSGVLQFGFDPKTDLAITNYRLFPLTGQMASAVQTLVQEFVIPADLDDIAHMVPGSLATVEGAGSLEVSAAANLLSVVNPLATVGTAVSGSVLGLEQGGSLTVSASYTLTGAYQVRVERFDGSRFRLGFERKRGSEFTVSVSAALDLSVAAGQFDLLQRLLQVISANPVPDKTFFSQGGLTDDRIATLADAVKNGLERSLALAIESELDFESDASAAFSYEIDASALNDAGRKAVQGALTGDLRGLEGSALPGVTALKSVFSSLREGKQILKFNLLGIFNYASVSELLRQGTLVVDRESGDITITDKTGAQRIQFTADNFAQDPDKLRKLLASSLLTTVAYRASKTVLSAPEFSSDYWFFKYNDQAGPSDLADYLRTVEALEPLVPPEPTPPRPAPDAPAGRATLFVDSRYGDALFRSLFLDAAGAPRQQTEYEKLGRQAMTLLVPPQSPLRDARLDFLGSDAIWRQLAGGPTLLPSVLEGDGFDEAEIQLLTPDFLLIRWWADAMSAMAVALAGILNFIGPRRTVDVMNDPAFQKLRQKLDQALAQVAATAKDDFGEPWGLVAMDLASGRRSTIGLRINSPSLRLLRSRP